MKTIVYLIRHSEPFEIHRGIKNTEESTLIENEKTPLSINGEKLAEEWASNLEFNNLDVVWSSNYVRAMSTAKYFAHNNNLKVNIDARFNERIHGIESWSELPRDFGMKQFNNEDYKVGYGESQKEVRNRVYSALIDVIEENKGKRIAIVFHATAMAFLLKIWCKFQDDGDITFDERTFFNGKLNYCQTFKLEFDENNNLLDISNCN